MPAPRITKKLENASDTNIVFLNGKLIVNGQSFRKTLGTYRHRVKEIKEHTVCGTEIDTDPKICFY